MATFSLCMIVKNEEAVLERCLSSAASIADEIIIVDTGSTDRTKEIAGKFTDKVFDYMWEDDFAAARNYSFSKARCDYCLWLDADDVLPEASADILKQEKLSWDNSVDVVMLPYQTAFDDKGNAVFSFERERIVKNGPISRWIGAVHEVIVPYGKIRHLDAPVQHRKIGVGDSDRNLRIYTKILSQGQTLDARQQYYYGRELYTHGQYEAAEAIFKSFLDNPQGWIENKIDASRQLAYCRYQMKKDAAALDALLYGLTLDVPRAETCCDIGRHFFDKSQFKIAVFWYELALSLEKQTADGGFIYDDCYGFIPCIQLCLCYDYLGEKEKAREYNEMAGQYKPDSPYYLHNKMYFENI